MSWLMYGFGVVSSIQEKNESLLVSLAPQIQGVLNNLALEVENSSC